MSLKSLKFHFCAFLVIHFLIKKWYLIRYKQIQTLNIYEYSKSHTVYNYFMFMKMNSMASPFPVDEKMSSLWESS